MGDGLMDYDFIATGKPVNRTAASVLSKGEHFDIEVPDYIYCKGLPPKINDFTGPRKEDLEGVVFGRFTVMGFYEKKKNGGNRGMWVVRCRCGNYSLRRGNGIKRSIARGKDSCCYVCDKIKRLKEWKGGK
jgi:hypothetical protein